MTAGMVIGLRPGQAASGSGCVRFRCLAGTVLAAGDPRRGDRLVVAVGGDEQPGGDVQGRAGAGEQGQRRNDDAHERDVGAEGAGYAAGHAGQHPVVTGPAQLAGLRAGR